MPIARKKRVSLDATPYYHCTSRCVRRAFLCGEDTFTGQSFEHRRGWIETRLLALAQLFAIDICAYAVMSNHYHVVLHVNKQQAEDWSVDEVIQRWHSLYKGNVLSKKYLHREPMSQAEKDVVVDCVNVWRKRLHDISWFMRSLNEWLARAANKEEQISGRFWEGRFYSQALLDEPALMACMAYVDLNPIRARLADTPEDSRYTSIKKRIEKTRTTAIPNHPQQQVKELYPFTGNPKEDKPECLPFRLTDYLELVDWSGRIIREDKKGSIPDLVPPILERLNIEPQHWHYLTTHFESPFKNLVGSACQVRKTCAQFGQKWVQGLSECQRLFCSR